MPVCTLRFIRLVFLLSLCLLPALSGAATTKRHLPWLMYLLDADNGSTQSPPTGVTLAAVNAQTVGSSSFSSSTQMAVSWVAPANATVDHYLILASESVGGTSLSFSATAGEASKILTGLKGATPYSIQVIACMDATCSSYGSASAVSRTTSEEYWQLQGSGNGYANATKAVAGGTSLSWVMRWGSEAGSSYNGRYQYYYKSNTASTRGIGIAATAGSDVSVPTLTSFVANTAAGLRNPCNDPQSTSGCPGSAAYFINAIQAVPMSSSGKVRVFFEAIDATESGQPTRIYSLDSQDGLVGQDFNSSASLAYCGGNGSTDYTSTGGCKPTVVLGVSTDSGAGNSPLSQARQFKIGWDWQADWRWNGATGSFMFITGDDACGNNLNALYYATWDGSKWTVATDGSGCAKPVVKKAHGPVLVPLGGAKYKVYYEDETNGTQSGKPLRFIYADGSLSGAAGTVDFADWESSAKARDVNFLWPDGTLLDAQDEAGLGDHMVLTPGGSLSEQYMFVNLGGFDNSKWQAASAGLGVARLLNP